MANAAPCRGVYRGFESHCLRMDTQTAFSFMFLVFMAAAYCIYQVCW